MKQEGKQNKQGKTTDITSKSSPMFRDRETSWKGERIVCPFSLLLQHPDKPKHIMISLQHLRLVGRLRGKSQEDIEATRRMVNSINTLQIGDCTQRKISGVLQRLRGRSMVGLGLNELTLSLM